MTTTTGAAVPTTGPSLPGAGLRRLTEIYRQGALGRRPTVPADFAELDLTMALSGTRDVASITRDLLREVPA